MRVEGSHATIARRSNTMAANDDDGQIDEPRPWYVYLLRCGDGSLYCGATNDVMRRIRMHELGKGARYTRAKRPVRLVFVDEHSSKSAALSIEARIKRMPRAQKELVVHDDEPSGLHACPPAAPGVRTPKKKRSAHRKEPSD
jgi:putative endonuclease